MWTKTTAKEGKGPQPMKGNTVTVHCTGFGKDGNMDEKFWSTKDPGQKPFSFKIGMGNVIRGWDEGVMAMNLGEKATLICPPEYAYGATGFPAWGILPNSQLKFEIELVKIE